MTRTNRHSKRQRQKDKRKAERKKAKKNKTGQKAGSIAIHSLLPGLEGIEIGAMEIVVDSRRKEKHPALINVSIHHKGDRRAIIWSIETGYGGQPPRVGYQVIPDGPIDKTQQTTWIGEVSAAQLPAGTSGETSAENPGDAEPSPQS